ncbi:MAG: MAPEG family protein [Myxococcales bacterium]|nr:MAPEG family protein [Myxococcales bacterium]
MTATPLIAAVLLLLVTFLSTHVSSLRIKHRISLGEGENRDLFRAIRAHANALEHVVPFVLLSLLLEETTGLSDLVLIAGVAFIVARLLHAFGMLRRIHRARQLGATLSVMIEIVLGVLLLRVGAGLVGL